MPSLARAVSDSVADPDPNPDPDQHVFGPPGSFYYYVNIVRKTLISRFLLFCDFFLTLKNDVKVPSKSNMQENFFFN